MLGQVTILILGCMRIDLQAWNHGCYGMSVRARPCCTGEARSPSREPNICNSCLLIRSQILTVPAGRHRSDHFPASRLLNVNVERSSRLRPWSTAGDCAPGSVESLVLDSRGSGRSVVGTDCYGRSSRRFEGRTWSKLCSGAALRADRALLSFFGECVRVLVLASWRKWG